MSHVPVRSGYKLGPTPVNYLEAEAVTRLAALVSGRRVYMFHVGNTVSQISPYIDDPNEIVRVWALEQYGSELLSARPESLQLATKAWGQARAEADAENILWTPVIDRLVECLSSDNHRTQEMADSHPLAPEIEERLAQLIPWIRQNSLSHVLAAIQPFKAKRLWRLAVRECPGINSDDIAILVQQSDDELFPSLLKNPALSDEWYKERVKEIAFWPSKGLHNHSGWGRILIEECSRRFGGLEPELAEPLMDINIDKGLLNEIQEATLAHAGARPEVIKKIWKTAYKMENKVRALTHEAVVPQALGWLDEAETAKRREIARQLISWSNVRPELIDWVAKRSSELVNSNYGTIEFLAQVIGHPHTKHEDAVRIGLEHSSDQRIRVALAKRDSTRLDPQFEKILHKSTAKEVLETMLANARTTEELTGTLRRMLKRDMEVALGVLLRMTIEPGIALPQSLFKQVLLSSDRELKIKAMTVIKRWSDAGALATSQKAGLSR